MTGLRGTGGKPPNGALRSMVEEMLVKQKVPNVKALLESPNTSIVIVSGFIPAGANKGAAPSAYLIDTAGTIGRAYGARSTPHMFIIDPRGTLIYAGGIDDTPSTDLADIKTAKNYVQAALDEALAGKPVSTPTSAAYGCSVKY